MEKYTPPYTITETMLNHVSSISEKVSTLSLLSNIESKPRLRKNNRIKSVYSSLKIEANSLSLGQVRDVINGKLVIGDQKEIQEVKNAYAAYDVMSDINPYSINDLLSTHAIMTKFLIDDSGTFRKGEEGVFSGDSCIFMAPPVRLVPSLMNQLFSWMTINKNKIHPLILSCVFHYEFVFIHPFSDGNGRMARLWHTLLLSRWKSVFAYIPIESQIEKFQQEYYQAIDTCNQQGNSTYFIEFMLSQIDVILDEVATQSSNDNELYLERLTRLLDVMDYNQAYTSSQLMELMGLKSREGFRRNYLHPAIELKLIAMTQPDKPNSRNQKYIKV